MTLVRIAFRGTPELAAPSLDTLARTVHEALGVSCQPDRPAGCGHELREAREGARPASPIESVTLRVVIGLGLDRKAGCPSWPP
jgi:hypothetical protein